MEVIRATKAGFCFGVKRALDMAEKTVQTSAAHSLGPLIHNQQVVNRMEKLGIEVVDTVQQARPGYTLIIRSHGVPPEVYCQAEERGLQVVDATCPFVQKAQSLAAESAEHYQVIVVGDKLHPEVQGILGWAGDQAIPVETLEEAAMLPYFPKIAVLAQTTQPKQNFMRIVDELRANHTSELIVHHTICNATEERQQAARELAQKVNVMIVVGGRNSANTQKLAAICAESTTTYLVESAAELDKTWFRDAETAGLTAGASTPDWIIEEVYKQMTEINELELAANENSASDNDLNMENWDGALAEIRRGVLVKGTVVKVTDEEVFLDIGWKSEGVIKRGDLTLNPDLNPRDLVSVGDEISAVVQRVENEEGYTLLSKRRADEAEAIEHLAKAAETKEEIQAKVVDVVKGGLLVDVGMRGFVPASQIQPGYVEDLTQFVGKTLRLRLIEFDPGKKKAVLSQKVILTEQLESKKSHLFATLHEGDVVKGTVRRLANFGAFIDLGGIDGLLHISDMAFSRVKHPSDLIKVGDELDVQILKINEGEGKISLGLKQLKASPWDQVGEKYQVGQLVTGKVVRITTFGAFVQLEDGVDALVHISQLADRRVAKVDEVVKVGDMIQAKVIELKPEEKRISLSIREAAADAKAEEAKEALSEQAEIPAVTIGEVVGEITPEPEIETAVEEESKSDDDDDKK